MLKNSSTIGFTKSLCYFGPKHGLENKILLDLFLLKPAIHSHVLATPALGELTLLREKAESSLNFQW